MKKIAIVLVLLASACALPPQTSPTDKQLAAFEARVEDFQGQLRIPGISAVILEDQQVIWAKGFGYADYEARIPATPDTVYHVASITKTFAATLVMQLVEQGKLDLDEPMSHYSSDFKNDSVRIKHLLNHTSGGPTPGERYEYSGSQYDYLTGVVEKKTGKSFRAVMEENILGPLGMSASAPDPRLAEDAASRDRYTTVMARQSQPYTLYGDGEIVRVTYPVEFFGAAAGLLSTVIDMAKFDAALDRHVLLRKDTQDRAWTPTSSNSGQRLPYGLGWHVEDYQGVRMIWHGGNWGTGFSAIYVKVPEKNLSLVMLSNSEALNGHLYKAGGEDIVNDAFACAFLRTFVFDGRSLDCEQRSQEAVTKFRDERRAAAKQIVQVDPKVLEPYVGQYKFEFDPTLVLGVTLEGGRLFGEIPTRYKTELFPISPSTFFLKIRPVEITFVSEGGQANHLVWLQGGETLRANRLK